MHEEDSNTEPYMKRTATPFFGDPFPLLPTGIPIFTVTLAYILLNDIERVIIAVQAPGAVHEEDSNAVRRRLHEHGYPSRSCLPRSPPLPLH